MLALLTQKFLCDAIRFFTIAITLDIPMLLLLLQILSDVIIFIIIIWL